MSVREINQSIKQLLTVQKWEKDKTQQAAQNYQQALNHFQDQKNKLQSLEQYRLNYLKQVQQNGKQGLQSSNYNQHLAFVGQLDKACEQQNGILAKANLVVDQRKRQWLKQQQKEKAVTSLIDKKSQQLNVIFNRQEQHELDEFAAQRYFRQKNY